MSIHSEHPFSVPVDQRDPARRFRGRLVAPVTILTAQQDRPVGLTVSSLLVAEGEPSRVAALIGAGSDLLAAVEASGVFLAHVLTHEHRALAEVFAGLRPAPGGMFRQVEVTATRWGPRLAEIGDWAGCRLQEVGAVGDQFLVVGAVEELAVTNLSDPLIHFRGAYRGLRP